MIPPPHDPEVWVTALRVMSVAMTAYFLLLGALLWRWWAGLEVTLRFLLLGLLAMSLVVGWGALESILREVPGGSRTIAAVPANLWACAGITLAYLKHRPKETQ